MSERSELFEALAELIERSEKRKSERASEVGVERSGTSRSKRERIVNKMERSSSARGWSTKRWSWEGKGVGKQVYR
jgi:hypothetical protein